MWYRREEEWIQAKKEKDVYQLPTDIFTYNANTGILDTEAVAIIAITRFDQTNCRSIIGIEHSCMVKKEIRDNMEKGEHLKRQNRPTMLQLKYLQDA